ncbi:aminotransferase class I and II domain-containing protein [Ditylenchus destructor]|nr:aminotransferase class I and II domain-containing protein [Ditylenchus destructor]
MTDTGYLRKDLVDYGSAANLDFNNEIKQRISAGENIHHFAFGESPFPVPEPFRRGLVENAHKNEYLSVQGLHNLRQKIIDFHKKFGDFEHFSPEDVVLSVGSKELIYQTMNVFGGEIVLPTPCWVSYNPQTMLCGKTVRLIETSCENKYVPTGQDIEKAISTSEEQKLLILNFPCNPTGVQPTEEQLKEIASVCRKYNVVVLSDEIYARLSFGKYNSISKYYPEGTIVTTGYSKWASLGGWRAGYGLFPRELCRLRDAVIGAGSHSYSCQAAPMQYAIQYGLDFEDELLDYINRSVVVLRAAGQYTHRKLEKVGVLGHLPEAGYYFMPDFEICRISHNVPNGLVLCQKMLDESNVALMACDPHFQASRGQLTTRFAFINFRGKDALENAPVAKFENDEELENFLQEYCKPLCNGVETVCHWVSQKTSGN